MKKMFKPLVTGLLISLSITAVAQPAAQDNKKILEKIKESLENLGGYLGYDLKNEPPAELESGLTNAPATQVAERLVFYTLLGATPVNAARGTTTSLMYFFAQGPYQSLNNLANETFKTPPYSSPSETEVSVSQLIDQPTFQNDPVSQAVLNILATPDLSYCMDWEGNWNSKGCDLLYGARVANNVIGGLPKSGDFFDYNHVQQVVPDLNSNTLLAPYLYSTEAQSTGGSTPRPNSKQKGLTAKNQAQAAANFIRYASGAVTPLALPEKDTYNQLYNQATNNTGRKVSKADQERAQAALSEYLTSLRTYAAQMSVAFSNFYYSFSKRMPQQISQSQTTSQALSEYQMATWRLFNPETKSTDKQWIDKINNASAATVQKEIAVLLSEINYQLYLNRQIQERALLTNTVQMLIFSKTAQPQLRGINPGTE